MTLQLLSHPYNDDFGVFGPGPFIEQHYRLGGIHNGNTELPICVLLYALALANDAKIIVETGTNNGAGATLWLAFAASIQPGGHFHGIDIDTAATERASQVCKEILPTAHCTFCKADAIVGLPKLFQPKTIDFLFVDDDHRRAHVEEEIKVFLPLMRSGGLMLFHDVIGVHEGEVWEAIKPYGGMRIVDTFHSPGCNFGGLGVIKVP